LAVIQNLLLSIGAMKSATSWLYMMLRDHPQIEATPVKEVHYFGYHNTGYRMLDFADRLNTFKQEVIHLRADQPMMVRASLEWFNRFVADPVDDAWFAGLYSDPMGPAWCAEFSNLNALLPQAGWDHVRRTAHRTRIIYILRNPLERLWSHTRFHLTYTGARHKLDEWGEQDFKTFLAQPEIRDHCHYARTLAALEQNFPSDDYHVILHDDIETAPHRVLAGLEAFLGIAPRAYQTADLMRRHNPSASHPMPPTFIAAAHRLVEAELAALELHDFDIPPQWLTPAHASRRVVMRSTH